VGGLVRPAAEKFEQQEQVDKKNREKAGDDTGTPGIGT
jgi:hypothetical protein